MLAVVVVYERRLDEVLAWPYLCEWLARAVAQQDHNGFVIVRVLVYDNSATPRARPAEPIRGLNYVHDASNGGTAAAYQCACREACHAGIGWLLLLDHDTSIPPGFIEAATAGYGRHRPPPCALLPWVCHGADVVSPARVTSTGTIRPLHYSQPAPMEDDLTGISSGSILHAATLAALMPFPSSLWLDYVDHWIFMQLRRRALSVVVFDARLKHDLSVSDLRTLTARRLTSVLDGEASFVALLGPVARLAYPLRLLSRALRYARTRPDLARHLMRWAGGKLKGRP